MPGAVEPKSARAEQVLAAFASVLRASAAGGVEPQSALLTVVSEVESYVDEILSNQLAPIRELSTPFIRKVADSAHPGMTDTWQNRHDWLRLALGQGLTGDLVGQKWLLIIEIRNALVHGRGSLSRRQQSDGIGKTVTREKDMLRYFGIEVVRGRLIFSPDFTGLVARAARDYVLRLDASFPAG